MLKRLAIVTVLGILAAVCFLEGQTAPLSPPKEGIAKSNGGQNGSSQPQTQDSKQSPPNTMPATPQPTAPTCDETCQQGRENLAIQRKLEWFTGVLAFVGMLQVGTMAWQAVLLRQTRSDIHTQANIMDAQAKDAKESGAQTFTVLKEQTDNALISAKAATVTAMASDKSAEAALKQVEATISKERARIFVFPTPDVIFQVNVRSVLGLGSHSFTFLNIGPTPAFNVMVRYHGIATGFESQTLPKLTTNSDVAQVIPGNGSVTAQIHFEDLFRKHKENEIPQVFWIHVFGIVEYDGIFTEERNKTTFRFRLQMRQTRGDGTAVPDGDWVRLDPKDNVIS